MSYYTDKVGYTVRFGGLEGVQWIKVENPSGSGLPPTTPILLITEVIKLAVLISQAIDMHKQALIQSAGFEERRIPWLTEMLLQWSSEVCGGQIRLDTAIHFDREITRLLEKLVESKMMDLPSILLLQVERCARGMASVNQLLAETLREEKRLNQKLPELIDYRPFWEVDVSEHAAESYLEQIDKSLVVVEKSLMEGVKGLFRAAVWHLSAWKAAIATAAKKQRMEEFQSLAALAIELKSLKAQLSYAALLPPREFTLQSGDVSVPTTLRSNGDARPKGQ